MGGKYRYLCVNSDCHCRTDRILFVLIGICVTNIVGCRLNTPATTSLTLATPTPTDTFIKRTLQLAFLQSPTQFGELWISSAFEAKVTRPTCTISQNCTEGSSSYQCLPNIILAFIIHQSPRLLSHRSDLSIQPRHSTTRIVRMKGSKSGANTKFAGIKVTSYWTGGWSLVSVAK